MIRLFFMRHGKSDWGAPWEADHQRPLAPRGERAAQRIGKLLIELGQFPELVITSSAARCRSTAELVLDAHSKGIPFQRPKMIVTDALYEASTAAVIDLLRQQDETIRSLLICGHEPTTSNCISALTGGSQVKCPTATLARLDLLSDSWSELGPGTCRLAWLVSPKLIGAADRSAGEDVERS